MDAFLRVDGGANLPTSPSNSFMAEDNASTCPLINPSPPTNDLINPLPEPTTPNFTIGEELAVKLTHVQDDEKGGGDSASSSSSALAEPACAQLLNHRNIYHHITKDEETAAQETNGKTQPLQLTFKNPPDNYFFMTWNWPLIRTISMYMFLAAMFGMVAMVVGLMFTLKSSCNPPVEWYQGSVFYEVFPASFYNREGQVGNFMGLWQQEPYLSALGVRGVRLNSIFASPNYPEDYENITSLTQIASVLGSKESFELMVKRLDSKNISVILDLPLYPLYKQLPNVIAINTKSNESFLTQEQNDIAKALQQWRSSNVKGFYLKGLEYFVNDSKLHDSLRLWKRIVGQDCIFIVSEEFINNIPADKSNIIYNNIDLVDVRLKIEQGVQTLTKQISDIQNGTLFSKRGMPWVHWSLGSVNTNRLANVLPFANGTIGATLLELMLPGTTSIFYGDEIGLQAVNDKENERQDLKHLHHLTSMPWPNKTSKILPWMPAERSSAIFDQVPIVSAMTRLRAESPSIYMNTVNKDGINKANMEVKYSADDFLVIQRWYPRMSSFVVASNLGSSKKTVDLSTLLYSGNVVVSPGIDSKPSTISFKDISLWPGESVVIVLD